MTDVVVVIEPQVSVVTAAQPGLPGPPGSGGGGAPTDFVHTQVTPAQIWVINHNLGRNVTVTLRTFGGSEFEAEILQVSLNQVQVLLSQPLAGTARIL